MTKEKLHSIDENKEILINKMYVGEYLENDHNHIGHEVINLLKSDQGENYIYVNPYGSMNKEHNGKIDTIILARKTDIPETLEIIGQAWDLTQLAEIKTTYNKDKTNIYNEQITQIKTRLITYSDKPLNEIFGMGEDNKNVIYYTFKAGKVLRPKKETRIFLTYKKENEWNDELKYLKDSKIIFINGNEDNEQINISKSSLKMYISNDKSKSAFKALKEVLESTKYWETENTTCKASEIILSEYSDNNFIDIIDKQNAEVTYSNFFQYIFDADKDLCAKFINDVLHKVEPKLVASSNLRIQREEGHIDLLIYDDTNKNVIVIENKIKSGINGIKYDLNGEIISNQLKDYYYFVNGKKRNGNIDEELNDKFKQYPNKFFFIFAPDYNQKINGKEITVNIKQNEEVKYEIINYSKIYGFYNEKVDRYYVVKNRIKYFYEFLWALEKHSQDTDNILEMEMFKRFKNSCHINTLH